VGGRIAPPLAFFTRSELDVRRGIAETISSNRSGGEMRRKDVLEAAGVVGLILLWWVAAMLTVGRVA
jgi:hypothetical protein